MKAKSHSKVVTLHGEPLENMDLGRHGITYAEQSGVCEHCECVVNKHERCYFRVVGLPIELQVMHVECVEFFDKYMADDYDAELHDFLITVEQVIPGFSEFRDEFEASVVIKSFMRHPQLFGLPRKKKTKEGETEQ